MNKPTKYYHKWHTPQIISTIDFTTHTMPPLCIAKSILYPMFPTSETEIYQTQRYFGKHSGITPKQKDQTWISQPKTKNELLATYYPPHPPYPLTSVATLTKYMTQIQSYTSFSTVVLPLNTNI